MFLLLTKDGLCRPCEITRQISLNEEFHISKVFHVFLPNNYIFYVAVDDQNKRFAMCAQTMSKPLRIGFYAYTDLIEVEVSESEPAKNMCNAMTINIYLNSLQRPHIAFYVINSPVQFGSKKYYKAVRMAKQVYAVLRYLQHNAEVVLRERQSAGVPQMPRRVSYDLPPEEVFTEIPAGGQAPEEEKPEVAVTEKQWEEPASKAPKGEDEQAMEERAEAVAELLVAEIMEEDALELPVVAEESYAEEKTEEITAQPVTAQPVVEHTTEKMPMENNAGESSSGEKTDDKEEKADNSEEKTEAKEAQPKAKVPNAKPTAAKAAAKKTAQQDTPRKPAAKKRARQNAAANKQQSAPKSAPEKENEPAADKETNNKENTPTEAKPAEKGGNTAAAQENRLLKSLKGAGGAAAGAFAKIKEKVSSGAK